MSILGFLIHRKDYLINIGATNAPLRPHLKISLGHYIKDMVAYPIIKGAPNTPLGHHPKIFLGHKDKGIRIIKALAL